MISCPRDPKRTAQRGHGPQARVYRVLLVMPLSYLEVRALDETGAVRRAGDRKRGRSRLAERAVADLLIEAKYEGAVIGAFGDPKLEAVISGRNPVRSASHPS